MSWSIIRSAASLTGVSVVVVTMSEVMYALTSLSPGMFPSAAMRTKSVDVRIPTG
jgi:hypothetical protein